MRHERSAPAFHSRLESRPTSIIDGLREDETVSNDFTVMAVVPMALGDSLEKLLCLRQASLGIILQTSDSNGKDRGRKAYGLSGARALSSAEPVSAETIVV